MSSKFVGSSGRRFKLWWSGNEDKIGGVGILVREDLCMNVVEINRILDRVMVVVIIFGIKVVRIVCAYAPQCGRSMSEKERFYEEMARGCEVENANEVLICLGDFNGHIGKEVDGFEGVHGGFGIGKRNLEGRLLLEFCVKKDLCVGNSWFKKKDSRKVTFNGGCSGTEIDFVLMKKRQRKFLMNVRVIGGELQHKLLKVVLDRRWLKNDRSSCAKKEYHTKVWKLLNEDIKTKFSEKMEVLYEKCDKQNAWLKYKPSVLKAAEEVCGMSKGRPQHGETWWCNQDVQKAISEKRKSFQRWKQLPSAENKSCYLSDKMKAKRAVAEAMKNEAVKEMEEIRNDKNVVFRRMRMMKKAANVIIALKMKMGRLYLLRMVGRECGRSTWRPS